MRRTVQDAIAPPVSERIAIEIFLLDFRAISVGVATPLRSLLSAEAAQRCNCNLNGKVDARPSMQAMLTDVHALPNKERLVTAIVVDTDEFGPSKFPCSNFGPTN